MIARLGGALLVPARRLAGAWSAARRTVALVPEAVEAILVLPRLSEQLEVVCFQTATLADMRAELARMGLALERVDANTQAVDQLAEVLLPLQGAALSVGRAADRWRLRR